MHITPRNSKETARDYAFRMLKNNIIMLELEPGSFVSENELSIELGVSRTPVREALMELSKSKIVEIYPQKGSYISKVDYTLVDEARFLRQLLEEAIIKIVCDDANANDIAILENNLKLQEFYLSENKSDMLLELDNEFHKQFFIIAKKFQTYQLLESMTTHFDRVRSMTLKGVKDIKVVEDHKAILEAIKSKNKDVAVATMNKHLSRLEIEKDEIFNHFPQYVKQENE